MQTLSKLSKGVWLKNLAITLVIVAVLLISGHAYVQVVQNNLWESSVNNAYSLTVTLVHKVHKIFRLAEA